MSTVAAAPPSAAPSSLLDFDEGQMRSDFDRRPFLIRHCLVEHPLFALPRLLELARTLPEKQVEYNAGDLPVSQDPKRTPRNGLSVEETLQRITECRSWMVLKYVETDPAYRALLEGCVGEVSAVKMPQARGVCGLEGFVFISSPGSVTPYHIDPECNFLLQVRGRKTMHVFDGSDRSLLSEEELERFHGGGHRNLVFKDEYQAKAHTFELEPGLGVHVPVTNPHWVKNGDEVSVSFSITFRTPSSEMRAVLHKLNHEQRQRGGVPRPVGAAPLRDQVRYNVHRLHRRLSRLWSRGQS
jgi:ribosomal protein L16 Arg81 hydroxylase